MSTVKNEPVAITSLVVAIVDVATSYGLVGVDQRGSLIAAITAAVPIILGLIARSQVTPNAKVPAAAVAPVEDAPVGEGDGLVESPAPAAEPTPEPATQPEQPTQPEPAQPVEDPTKAQLKAAIESVRANANALNDARAAAATAAIDNAA